MFKRLLLGALLATTTVGMASAAPIVGSFSLASFGGTYIGSAQTAATATGLDFGFVAGSTGNGYGVNGTALVGNAVGSFAAFGGTIASIADISLGTTANPYTANPFVSFAGSPLAMNFSNAALTRSLLGTSVTITGNATFTDGVAADATTGVFTLATSSQTQGNGAPASSSVNFTFTSNASATAVPEPVSIALLGMGLLGAGVIRFRRKV